MIKRYKIRLFPTIEQEELMWKHIHCCRFIWNKMLEKRITYYEENHKQLKFYSMCKELSIMRNSNEYYWLREVGLTSLRIICSDLDLAFERFFKNICNFPKFKSKKRENKSFPVRSDNGKFYFAGNFAKVEKIGKIRIKNNKTVFTNYSGKFYNPRILFVNKKWILSVGIEVDKQEFDLTDKVLGIDLGIKNLAVCSYNYTIITFPNINKSKRIKKLELKLKHLHKNLMRKYRTNKSFEKTNNILKIEDSIRRCYYIIGNIRRNYLHQTTTILVKLLPKMIVMETLNVNKLMKNKKMAYLIQGQCFSEFIQQIKYKCEYYGIDFEQVDKFYPSSQICSCCGNRQHILLSDRVYRCKYCGNIIDRDYNAAINLMQYGMNIT